MKKKNWQNYVNQLDSSIKTIWKMIRKISGKTQLTPLKHFMKNHKEAMNKHYIVHALDENFSMNSSLKNANWQLLIPKHNTEKESLNFVSDTLKPITDAVQRYYSWPRWNP